MEVQDQSIARSLCGEDLWALSEFGGAEASPGEPGLRDVEALRRLAAVAGV